MKLFDFDPATVPWLKVAEVVTFAFAVAAILCLCLVGALSATAVAGCGAVLAYAISNLLGSDDDAG